MAMAAMAATAIVERRMALIGRMEEQAVFGFLLGALGSVARFVGISLQPIQIQGQASRCWI
jgi:hypothetical protein